MDISPAILAVYGCGLLFGAYLLFVLRGSAAEFAAPKLLPRPERLQPPAWGTAQAAQLTPTLGDPLPTIRPPDGTLASSQQEHGELTPTRSDDDTEAAGLLRVLESASDIQRQAAARALALPFAGTCNSEVAVALAKLVREESAASPTRAEAWIALRAVLGEELSWDDEVQARHSFPEGLDEEWLDRVLATGEAGASG
jgi:hypothetical protein